MSEVTTKTKKETIKDKLSSKVVWVTAVPLIANVIATLASQGYADQFAAIATPIVSLLALFGILNNPNDKTSF